MFDTDLDVDLDVLSPAGVLSALGGFAAVNERSDVRILEGVLAFADRHPEPRRAARSSAGDGSEGGGSEAGRAEGGSFEGGGSATDSLGSGRPAEGLMPEGIEQLKVYGGEGCPAVAEFAAAELGTTLKVSSSAAAGILSDALGLRHRLPKVWARVLAGEARAWRACRIARASAALPLEAVALVDAAVEKIIDRVGPDRLKKIVDAAMWQADPERARAQAEELARARGVWIGRSDSMGTNTIFVRAATGDVIRLEATISALADALKVLGDTDALGRRRAKVIGWLADPAAAMELLDAARLLAKTHTRRTRTASGAEDPASAAAKDHRDRVAESQVHDAAAMVDQAEGPASAATSGHLHLVTEPARDAAPAAEPNRADDPAFPGAVGRLDPVAEWDQGFVPERDQRRLEEPPSFEGLEADGPPPPEDPFEGGERPTDRPPVGQAAWEYASSSEVVALSGGMPAESGAYGSSSGGSYGAADLRDGSRTNEVPRHSVDGGDDGDNGVRRDDRAEGAGDDRADWEHGADWAGAGDGEAFRRVALAGRLAEIKERARLSEAAKGRTAARVEVFVHLTDVTLAGLLASERHGDTDGDTDIAGGRADGGSPRGDGVLRVEGIGPVLAAQFREVVGYDQIVVKPVIDLRDRVSVDAYEIPSRIRERVLLRELWCVFPWCTRRATKSMDLDHVVPYRADGPPGQTSTDNLAPGCRYHHRLKTHGGWSCAVLPEGGYEWTSPEGARFVVDHTGTRSADEWVAKTTPGTADPVGPGLPAVATWATRASERRGSSARELKRDDVGGAARRVRPAKRGSSGSRPLRTRRSPGSPARPDQSTVAELSTSQETSTAPS
ncbi:HNH endonuclease signature motif containing protein [Kribbella deserti]|uniref:HNH nuclease domain-containing protein n=1 Tax=Kribbella deserti TaxID=1926257 RepID=A0ABV6QWS6_9ACTN